MRVLLISIIVCFFQLSLLAQNRVLVSFSKDSLGIGDTLLLHVNMFLEEGISFESFDLGQLDTIVPDDQFQAGSKDIMGDFEVLHTGDWQDINGNMEISGNEILWKNRRSGTQDYFQNRIEYKVWDAGKFVLFPMEFRLSDGTFITSSPASFSIGVEGVESSRLDSTGVIPIKPIIPENYQVSDYLRVFLPFIIPLLLILGAWLFIRYLRSRKTKNAHLTEEELPAIPAHEIALERLKDLKQRQLWQKGEIKAYQSEITHIIREYLENRYGILALESTTSEIVRQLKPLGFEMAYKERLQDILQIADLVKFAKAEPPEDIHSRFMEYAVQFVQSTKALEIEEEQMSETENKISANDEE